jgi:hypothetical protein
MLVGSLNLYCLLIRVAFVSLPRKQVTPLAINKHYNIELINDLQLQTHSTHVMND